MRFAAQNEDRAEGQEVFQQSNHSEVTQQIRQAGRENQNDGDHALNNNGESRGLIFGMNLTKLFEEQAVTSHCILDARLEHDAAGQRTDYNDDSHDGDHNVSALTNDGNFGSQQRDRSVGSSQLVNGCLLYTSRCV